MINALLAVPTFLLIWALLEIWERFDFRVLPIRWLERLPRPQHNDPRA